ncbi:MAG: ABC transporter ATP-binding protein [Fimbriimonadales bacterium]|jgi:ABC-type polysaccharide/polyol phosphate transport system ATPase subunit|nr:ABC transporter ATP-binding protein [Fimbriimonadales bacterium]GBC89809.1 Teichoic acids export ATP-binding protein TagH [bacterium HR14]CUU05918.1 ABC-2 type transport system ATP-binding protein [Armatimonadetes bacterium GBS]CUU37765.1 ABC-2 type transport system ATP-binding protein [Armatimonadetes bacterium GXS]
MGTLSQKGAEIVIRAQNLTKEFLLSHQPYSSLKGLLLAFLPKRMEHIVALKEVSFTIHQGETVGVIGRNGSGKSTLLGIIARVYRPTSGSITVNGRVAPLLELGAGFHPDLTGLENIYFNGVILGLTRRQVAERLPEIIAFAELEDYIDAPIRTYSSGMLMRLGFAIAAHVDADILLVDEVLAVGDAHFQQKCYRKIREFQEQGRTILFVSHDMEAVRQVAQRALWLDKGVLRADGEVNTVIEAYLQEAAATP